MPFDYYFPHRDSKANSPERIFPIRFLSGSRGGSKDQWQTAAGTVEILECGESRVVCVLSAYTDENPGLSTERRPVNQYYHTFRRPVNQCYTVFHRPSAC
jgi:hypothetical protein